MLKALATPGLQQPGMQDKGSPLNGLGLASAKTLYSDDHNQHAVMRQGGSIFIAACTRLMV